MNKLDQNTVQSLFALYRNGEFAALAERTQVLLKSYPRELVLHSLRGAACHELREYDAAVASYRAALAIRPDFDKIHNSLGVVYLRTARFEEAIASFRNALESNPEFAPAWFNAGIAFEHLKQWRNAADCFQRAVAVDPRYVEALTSLGTALWELGEYENVAGTLEQALAIREDHVPAWRGLLNFLEQANRQDELLSALERARNVLGNHRLVLLYEGILAEIEGDDACAREILESFRFHAADTTAMHNERQRQARLVGICDRLDDTAAALRYAESSNRLSRELDERRGITKDAYLNYIAHRRDYFTRDNVARWPAAPPSEGPPPVFIVSFPRSGTMLLDTILRGHPGIAVAEESNALPGLIDSLADRYGDHLIRLPDLTDGELRELRKHYFETLRHRLSPVEPDTRLIDCFALNIIYAGEALRLFPDAKIVLVLRHPADCVLSCYMQTFYEGPASANFYTLEEAAALYDHVFGLWEQYVDVLGPDMLSVKYEDIVAGMESACRPVLDFIGVPWHPDVLEYRRTARGRPVIRTTSYNQVTRPLHAGADGRWRRYRDAMQPVLPVLEPWIKKFGYSAD
jgi:Tfp pilus assembly protein PilF